MSLSKEHLYLNPGIAQRWSGAEVQWVVNGEVYSANAWDVQVLFTPKPNKDIEVGDRVTWANKPWAPPSYGLALYVQDGYAWVAWEHASSSPPMTCKIESLERVDG